MRKVGGIYFIFMLLISTAVLPVMGKLDEHTCEIQLYGVEWAKTYGGDEFDMFHCVHQTHDNGFIVSGTSEISNNYYPILMKLDSLGNEEWTWTIQQVVYEDASYDISDMVDLFNY